MANFNATPPGNRLLGWLTGASKRPQDNLLRELWPPEIFLEAIGREHSGKTALKITLYKSALRGAQPSGLELTFPDPRVVARMIKEAIEHYRSLTKREINSTQVPDLTQYHLYEADEQRAVLQWREAVGQLLTHVDPESPDEDQRRYREYVGNLAEADVLNVVLSCPTSNRADLERYEGDLKLLTAFLRDALRMRKKKHPCAVVVTITKIDGLFGSPADARKALTDERLREIAGGLTGVIEGSDKVGMAAIVPVSAFGFGTSVPVLPIGDLDRTMPALSRGLSPLSDGETVWILKEDATPEPFNLTGLVWWILMAGLVLKPEDQHADEIERIVRMLAEDLKAIDAWFLPLKCRGSRGRS